MGGLILSATDELKVRLHAQKAMRRAELNEFFWGKFMSTVKGAKVPYSDNTSFTQGVFHMHTDIKGKSGGAKVNVPIFGRVVGAGMGDARKLRDVDSTFSHDSMELTVFQEGNRITSLNEIEQLETLYLWMEIANPGMANWYARTQDEKMTAVINGLAPLNNGYGMTFENFLPGNTLVQRNPIVPYLNANGPGLQGRTYKMGGFTQTNYSDINQTCTLNYNQLLDLTAICRNERNRLGGEALSPLSFPTKTANQAPSGILLVTSIEGANQLRRDPLFREANENVDPSWKENPMLGTHIGSIGNIHVITTQRVMSPATNVQRALLVGAGAVAVAQPKAPEFYVEDEDTGGMMKAIAVHGIWGAKAVAFPDSARGVTDLVHKNSIAVDFWVD